VRIAIDARAAAEVPAGRGRYVRELLRALDALDHPHELLLLGRRPWGEGELGDRVRWVCPQAPGPLWMAAAARVADRQSDVVLSTISYALTALVRRPTAAVVFDFVAFDREFGAPHGALLERLTLPVAARRARKLVCISEATRDLFVERHPSAAAKAVVTPLAADPDFGVASAEDPAVPVRHGIRRPFVLAAGTLEPRKNLPRLIEAFARLPEELAERYELVLAGAPGWATQATRANIDRHAHLVHALGYVPDADLRALYRQAELVCYPSLEEGFGLPVLEAMTAGTAVLTSDRSSMPEVGGDAAVYADPRDVRSIAAGLQQLLADPERRTELGRRGRQRAARFTWRRTAQLTLEAIEAAASSRR
jgi:alpha-1,3-rhamnosyl/mannosyltransferase